MDDIIELERRFWEAAGDPEFYQESFADEGVMVFSGGILDKPAVVSLTYTTEAYQAGSDEPYRAAVTSVYAHRGERWRLVHHQHTPLAG